MGATVESSENSVFRETMKKLQTLKGGVGSLTLGILFALAFCPTSGVFYFGLLIPMAAISTGGMWFPVVLL